MPVSILLPKKCLGKRCDDIDAEEEEEHDFWHFRHFIEIAVT